VSGAFDGGGKPAREPSYRAALIMVLLLVLAIAALLLFASGALRDANGGGIDTQISVPQLESP
jgi:hypothetical protein